MAGTEQSERRRELAVTTDPRAARTRERIVDALGALLASGDAVSVASVCTRAGVGRSTFYTHFGTVADVVVHVVDAMFDELGPRDVTRRTEQTMPRSAITAIGLREVLDALSARRPFFLYAVSAPATERVRERFVEEMARSMRGTILAERPEAGEEFVRSAGEYLAGGVLAVLLGWLADPRGRSEQDIIDVIAELLPGWLTSGGEPVDVRRPHPVS